MLELVVLCAVLLVIGQWLDDYRERHRPPAYRMPAPRFRSHVLRGRV